MSFYDYSVPTVDGEELSMRTLEGKVVIVVNTATGCGFTPHYKSLQKMYEQYHEKGLEIIDVPCNQFAGQTPGTDEEIHEFCTLKYHTAFPQMKKSDVNGENALPLFAFLKQLKKIDKDYKSTPDIKWNFTKFVIDRTGQVIARFEPTADMKELEKCVVAALG